MLMVFTDISTQTDASIAAQGSPLLGKKKNKRQRSWDEGADIDSIPLFKVEVRDDGFENVPGDGEQEGR